MRALEIADFEDRPQPCLRLYTTGEVAKVLKVSLMQVQRLERDGTLPCLGKTGSGLRVYLWPPVYRAYQQRGQAAGQTREQRLAAVRAATNKRLAGRPLALRLYQAKGDVQR